LVLSGSSKNREIAEEASNSVLGNLAELNAEVGLNAVFIFIAP
jgi:hypothetical protein